MLVIRDNNLSVIRYKKRILQKITFFSSIKLYQLNCIQKEKVVQSSHCVVFFFFYLSMPLLV